MRLRLGVAAVACCTSVPLKTRETSMMTLSQLRALHRALASQFVLSAYVHFAAGDPASRQAWRTHLDHALKDLRLRVADSPRDCIRLERCIVHLEQALAEAVRQGTVSWCAFVTESGVRETHALSVRLPTIAIWSQGACLAPYLRVLREADVAVIAVADSRKVDLYQYVDWTLVSADTIRAHHAVESPAHMSAPASPRFHHGTHGTSGHDAAQRSLLAGRDRMLDDVAERIERLAGDDSWVLIGGIRGIAAHLADRLSHFESRLLARIPLDVHASRADIVAATRSAAGRLRDRRDTAAVTELSALEKAGIASLGEAPTTRALGEERVGHLYLTMQFLDTNAADAEQAVRAALDQHAEISLVSSEAAAHLDQIGGIAARLRYHVPAAASPP